MLNTIQDMLDHFDVEASDVQVRSYEIRIDSRYDGEKVVSMEFIVPYRAPLRKPIQTPPFADVPTVLESLWEDGS